MIRSALFTGTLVFVILGVVVPMRAVTNETVPVTAKGKDSPQYDAADVEGRFTKSPTGDKDEIHVTNNNVKGDDAGVYPDPVNDGAMLRITQASGPVKVDVEGREGVGAMYWVTVTPSGGAGGQKTVLWADVADLKEPGLLVLRDKNNGLVESDSTNGFSNTPVLYVATAGDDDKGDVDFWLIATSGTYNWTITQDGASVASGTLVSPSYKSEKLDLAPGLYSLNAWQSGNTTFSRCINFYVVRLNFAMDGNRNLQVEFGNPDDQSCLFWVNDDHDEVHSEEGELHEDDLAGEGDCDDICIGHNSAEGRGCERDLEDFTQLHIRVDSAISGKANVAYKLKFENAVSGTPEANIFEAVTPDFDYLTHHTFGLAQIAKTRLCMITASGADLPAQYIRDSGGVSTFLLEGKRAGKGKLTLIVTDGGKEIARTAMTIELRPIASFYEKYVVGVSGELVNSTDGGQANSYTYTPQKDIYLLHVHGWNMAQLDKDRWSETVFKRLWWLGYEGHVGSFQWPTLVGGTTYNRSEFRAWNSAAALSSRISQLDSRFPGKVRVIAHSMGNVVMGEALHQLSGKKVHTYIATQAAISAHCYDNTKANYWSSFVHPHIYGHYFSGVAPDAPYLAGNTTKAGRMVSYFNESDYALAEAFGGALSWEGNNASKPIPNTFYFYNEGDANVDTYAPGQGDCFTYEPASGNRRTLTFPADRFEIFARIAQSRSSALGRLDGVAGFAMSWDLKVFMGYDEKHHSHSREFRSNVIDERLYWDAVINDALLNQ